MKIVFFGTGEFSVDILKGLIENGKDVVAVVSQPDKVNGRNGKTIFSAIKQFCLQNGLKLFQFEKLNRDGEQDLKALNADIFITETNNAFFIINI